MDSLNSVLSRIPLFSSLSGNEVQQMVEQAAHVTAAPGELLLREGDYGDRMFVILKGAAQVFTVSFDGSDMVLARLEPGQWFGEQALLPGGSGRRNASVRALEECKLLSISREQLLQALGQNQQLLEELRSKGEEQRALRSGKLREGVFATLGLQSASDGYRIESYQPGATVFQQGDRGGRLYLVLSGRAQVLRSENGTETALAELLAGQFFGELAIMNDAPRNATVRAVDPLEVVSLDGAWFRESCSQNPTLRSLMESLSSLYLLPHRGLLTLQTGHLDGKPTLTAVHNLPDGRRVLSTRLVGSAAFTAQVLGTDPAAAETIVYEKDDRAQYRELQITQGKLTGLQCEGEWTGLGEMFALLLDGTSVEEWQLALFRERGDFHARETRPLYEEQEVICACSQATCGQILQAIHEDCTTVDAVAKKTRATLVCGGCAPLVRELLGQSDWTAAQVTEVVPLADDIRSFRIRPSSGECEPYLPGQHVVVQARVDNRWIQRAYTISSASGGDCYEITVKREQQGVFSRWLFDRMQSGSLLRISEPGGHYFLPEDHSGDVVCLVGGIGVTPALAMARTLAPSSRAIRLHVHYSVSHTHELICREEWDALTSRNPNISIETQATREQGRLTSDQVKTITSRFPEALFFLCGSESYMAGVQSHLRESGVPDERIRMEVFTVAGAKVADRNPAKSGGCPVDHSAHSVTVAEPPATPLEQARAMLRECYDEANAAAAFAPRWRQVEDEFSRTGTYRQTYDELVYAARVAWRNSVKCIGRLYWQGLAVRDYRHVETEDGMFEAIFSHIETAMNGGNLRPLMTVFPPVDKDGHRPLIWNPQLFRYAGYKAADGTVLGDPSNVELTEVAMALGWTPPEKRGMFDLLPVILQAGGRRPQWRSIPQHLVVEVPLVHPQIKGFAELGLKWYAMRAVSGMILDAGGVQYSAVPFNGWSMGTEIGARIFTDEQRYDLLPRVAQIMGLDTRSERTLWRDRAVVELNVAVLHSYEKAGVKIMDHHSASQAFLKFEDLEGQAGREVLARWSWIVPPISGSVTPVYHRDWPDVEIKPNYVAHVEPWKEDRSWDQPPASNPG